MNRVLKNSNRLTKMINNVWLGRSDKILQIKIRQKK